ncbi:MAG TPA: (deoxy)nucleoside triphosphate pyrophosphohydrolase [Micromonosporaceae bacterium]
MQTEWPTPRIIVGAAIIEDGRVLACARSEPPEFAGRWEFPGGKVEIGESEVEALQRECVEELNVKVEIGARIGADVQLGHGWAVLRVYAARLVDGHRPQRLEHLELRWVAADDLDSIDWLPADAPIVAALPPILGA